MFMLLIRFGAWTAVRKSLKQQIGLKTMLRIIRQINQAIEHDIGAAGGLDLLKKADQLTPGRKGFVWF